jgi:hypothetical protein
MKRVRIIRALTLFVAVAGCSLAADSFDGVFARLYNFDFNGAHTLLDEHIGTNPQDPLGYAMRSSSLLFMELDRLGVLESEFFSDDKRITDKKKLQPDPNIKIRLFKAISDAEIRAQADLRGNPDDTNALFSLCVASGVATDYTALVEKKQIGSLSYVKQSTGYAQRLIKIAPRFYDAYLSTGMTEYLLGSLPFFVRWFVRIDDVQGDKNVGIQKVELVAKRGRYLKPFAKILLAIAYLREGRPADSKTLLGDLAHEFPDNPLFRRELDKISNRLRTGELRQQN